AKHVPGRKTDISDAAWLQRLHEFGLLRGSFRPQGAIAALRAYLRQRERLLDYAAAHIQHMQKALTQMNLQIHHVISDITGETASGRPSQDPTAQCTRFRCPWSALRGARRRPHADSWAWTVSGAEIDQRMRHRPFRMAKRQALHVLALVSPR